MINDSVRNHFFSRLDERAGLKFPDRINRE